MESLLTAGPSSDETAGLDALLLDMTRRLETGEGTGA